MFSHSSPLGVGWGAGGWVGVQAEDDDRRQGGPPTIRLKLTSLGQIESHVLKGIYAEFQVIRGFSQKIPTDLLSYDKIHS